MTKGCVFRCEAGSHHACLILPKGAVRMLDLDHVVPLLVAVLSGLVGPDLGVLRPTSLPPPLHTKHTGLNVLCLSFAT